MINIAIIENGIVANVTGCENTETADKMYGEYVIITDVYPAIGWIYDGTTFINPGAQNEDI